MDFGGFRTGALRKQGLTDNDKNEIELLLESCFIADINPEIKKVTKELLQIYRIKIPDAIIAATAIYLDLPLLTADTGFKKINELKLILLEF